MSDRLRTPNSQPGAKKGPASPEGAVGLGHADGGLARGSLAGFLARRSMNLAWCVLVLAGGFAARGASPERLFQAGTNAYAGLNYALAATAFADSAALRPASGTLQNLGLAEWQNGRTGRAVLAWERALWVNPFNGAARENLRFVRKKEQLDSPDLTWYEVVSTWLPMNWWAVLAGLSLWVSVGVGLVPGLLRWRKMVWQQAAAALGLAVFLLSVPALFGVATRARLGFVLEKETALRLTPTKEAQTLTFLSAGEPARLDRARGEYVLVRTRRSSGWLQQGQLGLMEDGVNRVSRLPGQGNAVEERR
jgi:hypothetical protein